LYVAVVKLLSNIMWGDLKWLIPNYLTDF
jgi:hypothetical protein